METPRPESAVNLRHALAVVFHLLLLAMAVCAFYPKMLLLTHISPGGDIVNLMLPAREWAQRWLGRGIVPLWNPQIFGGVPFHAAMQASVFYPPHLILGSVLPPLWTINLLRVLHIGLFGLLTWLFLRVELRLVRPAALLGAIAVIGSAHVSAHADHPNQLAAIAWLPGLVLFQWRFWRTGRVSSLAGFAAILAMQVLAGHPQAVFYSMLLNGAVALGWFVRGGVASETPTFTAAESAVSAQAEAPRSGAFFRRRVVPLLLIGGAVVGGLMVSAVQLIPTAETSRFSRRTLDGPDYPLWLSMHPRFIKGGVFPRAWGAPIPRYEDPAYAGEFGSYVGRTTLLLALAALAIGVARRRWWALFWWLAVAVAFLLATGGFGPFAKPTGAIPDDALRVLPSAPFPLQAVKPSPVFEAYLSLFPPARHLRVPPRILLLATFGMAVLGAMGLNGLLALRWWGDPSRRRWAAAVGWGAVALLSFELWNFQRAEYHHLVIPYREAEVQLEGPAASALSPLLGKEVVEPSLSGYRVFRLMPHDPDYLMDSRPAAVRNRYVRLQPNLGMTLGVADVEGYEEGLLPPVRYFDFLNFFNRNLRRADPDPILLALMNVRYLMVDDGLPIESQAWKSIGEVPESTTGRSNRLYENPYWLPRVIWAEWIQDEISLGLLRGSLSRSGVPAPRETVAVRRYAARPDRIRDRGWVVEPAKTATLKIRAIEPNRIDIANPERRGGELLISQNAFPGWVVETASESVAVRPRTDFSGSARISPGAANIRVVYRPFSFRIGAYLTALAVAGWLAVVVALRRRPEGQLRNR